MTKLIEPTGEFRDVTWAIKLAEIPQAYVLRESYIDHVAMVATADSSVATRDAVNMLFAFLQSIAEHTTLQPVKSKLTDGEVRIAEQYKVL